MLCCFCNKDMYDITDGLGINYICYNIYCPGYYKTERVGAHFHAHSSVFEKKPDESEGKFYSGKQWFDMINQ